nr:MAG TPA: NADH-ubiquinone oxidoreductase [Caudoviricetes sp.]
MQINALSSIWTPNTAGTCFPCRKRNSGNALITH